MTMKIYLNDLNEETSRHILEALRYELSEEIEDGVREAARKGIRRNDAETAIIDDHLNRHNFGWEITL